MVAFPLIEPYGITPIGTVLNQSKYRSYVVAGVVRRRASCCINQVDILHKMYIIIKSVMLSMMLGMLRIFTTHQFLQQGQDFL